MAYPRTAPQEAAGSTALALVQREVGYTNDQVDFLKSAMNARNVPDDILAVFLMTAHRTGLDPLAKQIYVINRPTGYGAERRDNWVIQAGIDGYRKIAEDSGVYAGSDRPVFETTPGQAHPDVAIVTVWKIVAGVRCPFTAEARWSEYAQTAKDSKGEAYFTGRWKTGGYGQLAKCAEAGALRKGFPSRYRGVYLEDEMDQASNPPAPTVRNGPNVVDIRTGEVVDAAAVTVHEAEAAPTTMEVQPEPLSFAKLQERAHAVGLSDAELREEIIKTTGKKAHFTQQDMRNVALRLAQYEAAAATLAADKAEPEATIEAEAAPAPDPDDPDFLKKHPAFQTAVRP